MGESLEEIGERLRFLLEQYKQVELALGQDPQNEELLNARKELQEIVTLTEDLYNIKKAESMPRPPPFAAAPPMPAAAYHAAPPAPTSAWPAGGAPPPQPPGAPFAVGSRVQAIYQADGLWYEAVIDAITDDGIYKVRRLSIRPRPPPAPWLPLTSCTGLDFRSHSWGTATSRTRG
jgi:hypothetical protein